MSEHETLGREVESFDDLHSLPPDAVVVDSEGNRYKRDRRGLWSNRFGYFPAASEVERLMPFRVLVPGNS